LIANRLILHAARTVRDRNTDTKLAIVEVRFANLALLDASHSKRYFVGHALGTVLRLILIDTRSNQCGISEMLRGSNSHDMRSGTASERDVRPFFSPTTKAIAQLQSQISHIPREPCRSARGCATVAVVQEIRSTP
jgi:hypothetical protein